MNKVIVDDMMMKPHTRQVLELSLWTNNIVFSSASASHRWLKMKKKMDSWWHHLFTLCSKLPAQMSKNEHIVLQFILKNKGFAMQCTHLSRRKYKKIVNKPGKLKSGDMIIIAYFSINTTTDQHIKMHESKTRTAGRWMVSAVNSSTTVEVK